MKRLTSYSSVIILLAACKNNPAANKQPSPTASTTVYSCYNAKTTDKAWYSEGKKAPVLKGLQGIDFRITTNRKEAQEYFNQGMMLAYGFNHAEAARSFYEATRLDSTSAMAYWGF